MLSNGEPIPPHIRTDRSDQVVWDIPGYLGYIVAQPTAPAAWTLPPVDTQVRGAPLYIRNQSGFSITLSSPDGSIGGPTVIPGGFVATVILADQWYCTIADVNGGATDPGIHSFTLTTGTFVATDVQTTVASVPWRQALMAGITRGTLVYGHREVDVPLGVVLRTDLGQLLATQVTFSSGVIDVLLGALPVADCMITLRIYKLTPGGTAPQLLGSALSFR